MKVRLGFVLIAGLVGTALGCGGRKPYYDGPKVPAFSGQVVQNGKPVTFPEDEDVSVHCTVIEGEGIGKAFGVPIKPDGSFSIGWMPVGKMMLRLERSPKDPAKRPVGPPSRYSIPGGLTIEQGKTTGYVIDLGKGWKR
jgi:hypothetical protein